jgi:DnaJ-class molecular chaperone
MRARSMIQEYHRGRGLGDAPCPACGGAGRVGEDVLERCPVCGGFGEVPESLARYVRVQLTPPEGARSAYA